MCLRWRVITLNHKGKGTHRVCSNRVELNGLRASRGAFAAFPTLSGVLRLLRQHRVNLCHHGGSFSDRGRDPFGRAGANVADGEHAR